MPPADVEVSLARAPAPKGLRWATFVEAGTERPLDRLELDDASDDRAAAVRELGRVRDLLPLRHPNLAVALRPDGFGEDAALCFEPVRGTTFTAAAASCPRDAEGPTDGVRVLVQDVGEVLSALAFAHRRGYTHGSIAADRIRLLPEGGALLVDWEVAGLAWPDGDGAARDADEARRADLRALGAVLEVALVGPGATGPLPESLPASWRRACADLTGDRGEDPLATAEASRARLDPAETSPIPPRVVRFGRASVWAVGSPGTELEFAL